MQSYIAIRLSNAPSMKWGPDLPLILSCKMRANGSQFFPNWDKKEDRILASKSWVRIPAIFGTLSS
jgi:hypothetical protein